MTAADYEPEAARVVRQLRDEIIEGVRPPGSKLVERDVAAELGVSRLPVREALRVLVSEGLVTPRPRTWAVVREFTDADIADLNEVRSALEVLTLQLAAQRHDPSGLSPLKRSLDAEFAAARDGDAAAARRAAADFHEALTALTGNDLLAELQQTLRSRMRWLMGQHDDLLAVAEEHAELYDAIVARDAVRVTDLAHRHVRAGSARARRRSGPAVQPGVQTADLVGELGVGAVDRDPGGDRGDR